MSQGRIVALSMALAGLLIAAFPALASARVAYFTGISQTGGYAAPVDVGTQLTGSQVPIAGGGESAPPDVAIAPDGATAYVADGNNAVIPISVAADTAGASILVGAEPWAIAIAPDGKSAYVVNRAGGTVSKIDLATATVTATIAVGTSPTAIAITPDGSRAYVANSGSNNVSVIDLTSGTAGAPIVVGNSPSSIAITPDGAHVYVTNSFDETMSRIETATNTVSAVIPVVPGQSLAISPDGSRAYALRLFSGSGIVPIDLPTGSAGSTVPIANFPEDLAILPDGSYAFVTIEGAGKLAPVKLADNTVGTEFNVGNSPNAIAIVPNQPPHAAFSNSPATAKPGASVAFDASGSTDSDGTVARYDWDFGDGASAANGGAKPSHTYAKAGTYQVTLTTTDNEGCSTAFVFTGQTAYCNGSSVARVTHPVTVVGNCPKVEGTATSFVPKLVSHHVVPGVRVRLTVNAPAHLAVKSTLLWAKEGESGRAYLGEIDVNVNHWRRLRMAIPAALRDKLPLGTPVKVSLHIHATPLDGDACAGNVTHPTLRVHVVKVIPSAVQLKRAR